MTAYLVIIQPVFQDSLKPQYGGIDHAGQAGSRNSSTPQQLQHKAIIQDVLVPLNWDSVSESWSEECLNS